MTMDTVIDGAICETCRKELAPNDVAYTHHSLRPGESYEPSYQWPVIASAVALRTARMVHMDGMQTCGRVMFTARRME